MTEVKLDRVNIIINGKKPVPERVRQALTQFYLTEEV